MKLKLRLFLLFIWIAALAACFYRPAAALIQSAQGGKRLFHFIESTTLSKERFPCLRYTPLTGPEQAEYRASIEYLQASDRLNPTYSPTSLLLANAYCLSLDKDNAAPFYDAYARANPRDPWGTLNLLAAHSVPGEDAALQEDLKNAHLTGPELAVLYKDLATNRPDMDALPYIEKAAELSPSDKTVWNTWLAAGSTHEQNQQWDMAMKTYQSAVQAQERGQIQYMRGKFYLMIGRLYQNRPEFKDLHTALDYYQKALQNQADMAPSDVSNVHYGIAGVYRGLRPEYTAQQAIQEYQLALQINPNAYWTVIGLGQTYWSDLKDLATAKAYFHAAVKLAPQNPDAYLYLGDIYRKEGNIQQAETAYQEALLRKPDWAPAKQRLTEIAKGKNQ